MAALRMDHLSYLQTTYAKVKDAIDMYENEDKSADPRKAHLAKLRASLAAIEKLIVNHG